MMVHALPLARLSGLMMIAGGALFCVSSDFALFPYALLLCMLGLMLAVMATNARARSWRNKIGLLALGGALAGALAGIAGRFVSAVVFTDRRYGETSDVVDVINYPLSYFTDRYGSIAVFLLLGLGLLLLARAVPADRIGQASQRVRTLLAVLSLALYGAAAIDVYLDGEVPGLFVAVLWGGFGLGWMILGLLLVADRGARLAKGWLHAA